MRKKGEVKNKEYRRFSCDRKGVRFSPGKARRPTQIRQYNCERGYSFLRTRKGGRD